MTQGSMAQGDAALDTGQDAGLEIRGRVATITIDRPSKINALRLATWQTLLAMVNSADSNPEVSVIVVRGAGRDFSAGNDISVLSTFPGHAADAQVFAQAMADAMRAIEEATKPVLMAIEGVCYGGALAMSLAGDVRIASSNAVFSIPVAKLGALYLHSDLQRLVAAIGVGQSTKLIYTSETCGAEQARQIGLIDEVFIAEHFETELRRFIETILAGSPYTLMRSKAMLRQLGHGATTRETASSLASFVESTQSADFAEGIAAFLARRTARFSNRSK